MEELPVFASSIINRGQSGSPVALGCLRDEDKISLRSLWPFECFESVVRSSGVFEWAN